MKKLITSRHITIAKYSLLFIIALGIWIWEIKKFDEYLIVYNNLDERYELESILYGFKITNLFTASISSLILVLGLFLKNKTGWILVTGWYYLLITNVFQGIFETGIKDAPEFFHALLSFSIPISLIFVMNKFNGIKDYHKIKKSEMIRLNLLAFGVGILLAVFRVLKKYLLQQYL